MTFGKDFCIAFCILHLAQGLPRLPLVIRPTPGGMDEIELSAGSSSPTAGLLPRSSPVRPPYMYVGAGAAEAAPEMLCTADEAGRLWAAGCSEQERGWVPRHEFESWLGLMRGWSCGFWVPLLFGRAHAEITLSRAEAARRSRALDRRAARNLSPRRWEKRAERPRERVDAPRS